MTGQTLTHIGRNALHASRRALTRDLGAGAPEVLQEIGYTAGEELYDRFCAWLPDFAGLSDPADLDAAVMGEVLSAFFESIGWGTLSVEHLGSAGLALDSADWAEAEPGADVPYPSCFISAGLLADFVTRLADGATVSIMEVECRSRGDERCRFLAGSPETLERAYEAISSGRDYRSVF
ncbi:MAG: V4R domain-containing protein [Gemmatimonadales bacterium]